MLRTKKGYVFDTLNLDSMNKEFTLRPNDVIEFRLFANDGYKLVDILGDGSAGSTAIQSRTPVSYEIDPEGKVRLPVIGEEVIEGMTVRQAQAYLEQRYSSYYVSPFIVLKIVNRRVIVFPGDPGTARVLGLDNTNVTVLEGLALAGGLSNNGKANNIKLIRQTNDPKHPTVVYKLNLSTIDGLAQGNIVLQTNDIIYVEPRKQYIKKTLGEITPTITLITSLITFYYVITRLH
jgi:polysaccharide export outer membrane protein